MDSLMDSLPGEHELRFLASDEEGTWEGREAEGPEAARNGREPGDLDALSLYLGKIGLNGDQDAIGGRLLRRGAPSAGRGRQARLPLPGVQAPGAGGCGMVTGHLRLVVALARRYRRLNLRSSTSSRRATSAWCEPPAVSTRSAPRPVLELSSGSRTTAGPPSASRCSSATPPGTGSRCSPSSLRTTRSSSRTPPPGTPGTVSASTEPSTRERTRRVRSPRSGGMRERGLPLSQE